MDILRGKVIYCCSACGSLDVRVDAEWDVDDQQWRRKDYGSFHETGLCHHCNTYDRLLRTYVQQVTHTHADTGNDFIGFLPVITVVNGEYLIDDLDRGHPRHFKEPPSDNSWSGAPDVPEVKRG